jgi:hypothetical protein
MRAMRGRIIGAGTLYVCVITALYIQHAEDRGFSAIAITGLALGICYLYAYRRQHSIRIYEQGLESDAIAINPTRFLWGSIAAYRMSWHGLRTQYIVLIEQETKREMKVPLDVFLSAQFQLEAGRLLNLDLIAKVGLP